MAESWITKCGSRLIYELLPGKEILYVIPITPILGNLPIVRSGDTGTIPYRYCGTNRFNRNVARADSDPGSGNGSPMYFVNSWALESRVICKCKEYIVESIVKCRCYAQYFPKLVNMSEYYLILHNSHV